MHALVFSQGYNILTHAWLGEGYLEPSSRFSSISSKWIKISAPNIQDLLVHQFYTFWKNTNFVPIIGRPEWRQSDVMFDRFGCKIRFSENRYPGHSFWARTIFWHEVTQNWCGYTTPISDFQTFQKWEYMTKKDRKKCFWKYFPKICVFF